MESEAGKVHQADVALHGIALPLFPDVRHIPEEHARAIAERHAAIAERWSVPTMCGVPSTINFTTGHKRSRQLRRSLSHEAMFRVLRDGIWPASSTPRRIIEDRLR